MSTPSVHVKTIWFIFQIFAVYPLDKVFDRRRDTMCSVWRGFMLISLCTISAYTVYERHTIFYTADVIGHVNDIFKYASLAITPLIIIIESHLKRKHCASIWEKMSQIRQYGKLDYIEEQLNKRFAFKFWLCNLVFGLGELLIATITLAIDDDQWFKLWTVKILPLTICRLMCLLHTYYMDLLASYFRFMRLELEEIVRFSKYSLHFKVNRKAMLENLEALKDMYGQLRYVLGHVNEVFSWMQAFNFTRMFIQCTCDMNWMYKSFESDAPILTFSFTSLILCFVVLLNAATYCVKEANGLAPLLHQIKHCSETEMGLSQTIQRFAMQMSQETVQFGSAALYTIDYGLLRTMIAGIVTYMIIYIQMA